MKVIICIDKKQGRMFNKRRQSRDRKVYEDIAKLCRGKELVLSDYSRPLFEGLDVKAEGQYSIAHRKDFCFIEDMPMPPEEAIEEFIIYEWNREYPADVFWDLNPDVWEISHKKEFSGTSHDTIIRKIYKRREKNETE